MRECIKRQNQSYEYYATENCYITELPNTPDDPDASIARARVKPGVTTRRHRLRGTAERYYILSGKGGGRAWKIACTGSKSWRHYPHPADVSSANYQYRIRRLDLFSYVHPPIFT